MVAYKKVLLRVIVIWIEIDNAPYVAMLAIRIHGWLLFVVTQLSTIAIALYIRCVGVRTAFVGHLIITTHPAL